MILINLEENKMSFMDTKRYHKGSTGEEIIKKILTRKGYIIYSPSTLDKPHSFDILAIKDKEDLKIAEVKSKSKRKYYPDTGINLNHYNTYKKISQKHNIDLYIFFVDEEIGSIYGNKLSELEKEAYVKKNDQDDIILKYPLIHYDIIYFPMVHMQELSKLESKEMEILKEFTSKADRYL
jgi:hypothetical protein